MSDALERKIDKLSKAVEAGFDLMSNGFAAAADDVHDLTTELKAGFLTVGDKLAHIEGELAHVNRRLDALEEHYANLSGVTKEIDDVRDRVRAIEKHLGLNKKIAA